MNPRELPVQGIRFLTAGHAHDPVRILCLEMRNIPVRHKTYTTGTDKDADQY